MVTPAIYEQSIANPFYVPQPNQSLGNVLNQPNMEMEMPMSPIPV